MSFPRYTKYKDSGVEWLGTVPEHWAVKRLKFLCDIQTGDKDTENAVEDGTYPFFVRSQTVERINSFAFDCEAVLTAGDGVGVGKVFHYHHGPFDFHQRVYMLNKFRQVAGRYLFHFLRENFYKVALEGGAKSTVDSLRRPLFTNFPVAVPPADEQQAIVELVEREAAKIDELVAEQRRLMELLKEKRQAVISHAVTRGLNPAAPLKPSGIEWLGDVPAHWDVKRLKYLGEAIIGLTYSPADIVEEGDGTLVLRSSNVQGGEIVFDDNVYVSTPIPDALVTRAGDILICSRNGSRALIGKNATIDERSAGLTFGAFMTIFRSPHSDYIACVLNSPLFEFQSGAFMTSTINQLTVGVLNNFEVPLPPASEREDIAAFLKLETAKFDTLTAEAQRAIDLLQERRTALISAAVTGQIDVRMVGR